MIKRFLTILCGSILFFGMQYSYAGPIQSELKSYRCLVPDFLVSSGGTSPALSPDGTVLVYLTQQSNDYVNDKVWVLTDADKQLDQASKSPPLQPWELKISEEVTEHLADPDMFSGKYRNVDWSPDGKRVVFSCNGRLYIAELDDLKAKQTKAKKLIDIVNWPNSNDYVPNLAPRWSPDGTRVVFLFPSADQNLLGRIYVVDVSTGDLTIVAQDAIPAPQIWEQPWSSDGNHIVYSSLVPPKEGDNKVVIGGISIAAAGGGQSKRIINKHMTLTPSWSPLGNRIAYMGFGEGNGLDPMSMMIYISDTVGEKPVRVGGPSLSETAKASVSRKVQDSLLKTIRKEYTGVFTKPQIDAVSHMQIIDTDIMDVVVLAEIRIAAEAIGGDFFNKVKDVLKQLSGDLKNLKSCAAIVVKAKEALPEEKRKTIDNAISERVTELIKPWLKMQPADKVPVWSPDGKRLAFVRSSYAGGKMELLVVNIAAKESHTVFESNAIGNVSWAGNGKLLFQAKRDMAYTRNDGDSTSASDIMLNNITGSTATTVSYPEVWLLELK